MKNPALYDSDFKRDTILSRSTLVKPEDIVKSDGLEMGTHRIIVSGNDRITIYSRLKVTDLSGFNFFLLSMRNLSDHPLLIQVRLKHVNSAKDQNQESYSFSGGREVLHPGPTVELGFPFDCFGKYGKPSDWQDVEQLEIELCHEKFFSGRRNFKVEFVKLEVENRLFPQGPRLTDQGMERLLTDTQTAEEHLLTGNVPWNTFKSGSFPSHLQNSNVPFTRHDPDLYVPSPHFYPVEIPLDVWNGRIMGQQTSQNSFWDPNPLNEFEWSHFLHRHHFIRSLIQAFVQTGEMRMVERIVSIISDWITVHPVPVDSNGGAGPAWETLSVAWRLREWFWIVGIIWPQPSFPREVKQLMLRSIWEHAQSLMDHQGHPNNWIIVESSALAVTGLLFPAFQDSATWFETGLNRLIAEVKLQFLPDGAHFEISPLYHAICINALLEFTRVAEFTGQFLPSWFHDTIERGFEYLMIIGRPNFTWPSINDSGGIDRDYTQIFLNASSKFKRLDFEWVASRGRNGTPPKQSGLTVFRDAGIGVIRANGDGLSRWALFRAGPVGAFHGHNDLLSLEIFHDGVPWLVDPGITGYSPGILTTHYRSSLAHNMLVIDGVEPQRTAQPIEQRIRQQGSDIRIFEGASLLAMTGLSNELRDIRGNSCQLKRTIILVENRFWILLENIVGSGLHEIVHNWQFSPHVDKLELIERNIFRATAKLKAFSIQIVDPFLDAEMDLKIGSLAPPRGWVSVNGADRPAYSVKFHTATRLPCRFCWLIHDTPKSNDKPHFAELRLSSPQIAELTVYFESHLIKRFSMPAEFCI